MKRKILQFQFVWPMEGGHLRRELCFYMKMFTNDVDDPISFLGTGANNQNGNLRYRDMYFGLRTY